MTLQRQAKDAALAAVNRVAPGFPGQLPVVLSFHAIADVSGFRANLGWLARSGRTVVPLSAVSSWLAGQSRLPPKCAVLTFDDGYIEHHGIVAPELQRRGFPATFFVTTGHFGGTSDWAKQSATEPPLPLMDKQRVLELAEWGFEVGAHSHRHPYLSRLPPGQLHEEVVGCKQRLEDLLCRAVSSFCYPYGDWSPEVREAVRSAGFSQAVTVERQAVAFAADPWALPRMTLPEPCGRAEFRAYLTGTILPWLSWRRGLEAVRHRLLRRPPSV